MAMIQPPPGGGNPSVALESYVARSRNFLERMLDQDGLPYFNVFWTAPAEAAHDWPDPGDLTSRYLEAAAMLRHLTGAGAATEARLRERFVGSLSEADGLLYRPASPYWSPCADLADQALALCALYAWADGDGDATARERAEAMVRTLAGLAVATGDDAYYPGAQYRDGRWIRAFFQVWRSIAESRDGVLRVHLHLDKALPEAEIRGGQPYAGWVRVTPRVATPVAVRAPDFVALDQLRASVDGLDVPTHLVDGYLHVDRVRPGATLTLSYPLPTRSEEIAIGNPGRQRYRYRVTWTGDTVVEVRPLGNPPEGYTRLMGHPVRLYYDDAGPGPLYQRRWLGSRRGAPVPTPLRVDRGAIHLY